MTNELFVLSGADVVAQRALGSEAVQVGSASDCDVRLDHPHVPPRAYLVQERAGTVWLHDLSRPGCEPQVLAYERQVPVGPYALVRRRRGQPGAEHATQPMARDAEPVTRWTLLLGKLGEARRVALAERPFKVGSGRDNDWVVSDPTVSQQHCRFEPSRGRLWVRDLGSTNGTFVQGVRMQRAELAPGMRVRIGRTDLHVLAHAGQAPRAEPGGRTLVAASAAMQELVGECQGFARLPWPVLVLGPSGSGKEEVAQLLHRESTRRARPFVALNAGGLPRELIESELFGHEKGAFTGAVGQRRGAFEQAHEGTLFLDEIGELPLDLQARLLRVLETWQIRRVGGEQAIAVDVRLVCATHCDLARMVRQGSFREDLYYRLAHFVVKVPALSERPDDVLALAEHFLARLTPELGPRRLGAEARTRLLAHRWPGNARELRNVLAVAAAMCPSDQLEAPDIEQALRRIAGPGLDAGYEPEALERALGLHRGNIAAAARALGLPRSTLRDQLKKRKP
jgi:transcriptional regulator with AAA-type ATPase domain